MMSFVLELFFAYFSSHMMMILIPYFAIISFLFLQHELGTQLIHTWSPQNHN